MECNFKTCICTMFITALNLKRTFNQSIPKNYDAFWEVAVTEQFSDIALRVKPWRNIYVGQIMTWKFLSMKCLTHEKVYCPLLILVPVVVVIIVVVFVDVVHVYFESVCNSNSTLLLCCAAMYVLEEKWLEGCLWIASWQQQTIRHTIYQDPKFLNFGFFSKLEIRATCDKDHTFL